MLEKLRVTCLGFGGVESEGGGRVGGTGCRRYACGRAACGEIHKTKKWSWFHDGVGLSGVHTSDVGHDISVPGFLVDSFVTTQATRRVLYYLGNRRCTLIAVYIYVFSVTFRPSPADFNTQPQRYPGLGFVLFPLPVARR